MDDLFGFKELFPLQWSSPCVCLSVCMSIGRWAVAVPHQALWVMAVCRWEGEQSPALLLHPCTFYSLSSFLPRPHLLFCVTFFFSWLFCLPLKKPESAQTWGSKEEKGSVSQKTFIIFTGPPAKTHLCAFLLFLGINLFLWQWVYV